VLDLELLVHAALAVLGAAVPRDRQLTTLDLQGQLVRIDARQLGAHDDPGWIVGVVHVDRRREPGAPARQARAFEHVAEELVHLAPHALEVGEQVAFG